MDLVVEDTSAEEVERVRARKEGGSAWNEVEPKRYVKTYPGESQGEDVREGFEPTDAPQVVAPKDGDEFAIGNDDDASGGSDDHDSEESRQWKEAQESEILLKPKYGTFDEANVWGGGEPSEAPRENP